MRLKYISWLPAILMMVIIFSFSSKPAVTSAENSLTIANGILTTFEKISNVEIQEAIRIQRLNSIDFIVRKGAHCFEFAVLAASIAFCFWTWGKRGKLLLVMSIVFSAVYATTDELHQLFVPGRSGQIKDVCIDTTGAIIGTLIFYFIVTIYWNAKKKHMDKKLALFK